jgi:hypothetical protein
MQGDVWRHGRQNWLASMRAGITLDRDVDGAQS